MKIPKNDGSGGFWYSNLHPELDEKPKVKPDGVVNVRLLLDQPGQLWTFDGPGWDLKRGDVIRLPQLRALGYAASGLVTEELTGDMPTRDLDKTPEAIAASKHPLLVAEVKRLQPPKPQPTQQEIDVHNRLVKELQARRERMSGWV